MSITIGSSLFWLRSKESADYFAVRCPVGTTLGDRSKVYCKSGGSAWIVAPFSTEVSGAWAGGQYNTTLVGTKCCICEWPGLCTRLIACGFNPCDWFIPNTSQLQSAYNCRCNWDLFISTCYWTSIECNASSAYDVSFTGACTTFMSKSFGASYRAIRCVTY